jgi:hypothetical protein
VHGGTLSQGHLRGQVRAGAEAVLADSVDQFSDGELITQILFDRVIVKTTPSTPRPAASGGQRTTGTP